MILPPSKVLEVCSAGGEIIGIITEQTSKTLLGGKIIGIITEQTSTTLLGREIIGIITKSWRFAL
jgi:hypothetical protein